MKSSDTGTRTQVARVKAEYPNQLDYIGMYEHRIYCKSQQLTYHTATESKTNKGRWRIRTADLSDPNGESYH